MIELIISSGLVILGWFGHEISDGLDRRAARKEREHQALMLLCEKADDCEPLKHKYGRITTELENRES